MKLLHASLIAAGLAVVGIGLIKVANTADDYLPIAKELPKTIESLQNSIEQLKKDAPQVAHDAGEQAGKGAVEGAGKTLAKAGAAAAVLPTTGSAVIGTEVAKKLSPQNAETIDKVEKVINPLKWKF